MFANITKALVAALVLTGVSLSLVANASAAPRHGGWQVGGESYMQERTDPTNTNGY